MQSRRPHMPPIGRTVKPPWVLRGNGPRPSEVCAQTSGQPRSGWLSRSGRVWCGRYAASGIGQSRRMQQDRGANWTPETQSSAPPAEPGIEPAAGAGGTLRDSLTGSGVALRPATLADTGFCYELHKAAMGEYITAIWGWDEQVQRAFHQHAFNPDRWQIITAGQTAIGMLDVEYRLGEIYLARIEIHPGHQGRGIGTRIISALVDEAQRTGRDLVLDVLAVNRRARTLYRRLGLTETGRHGDGGIKITMRSARHSG